MLNRRKSFAVYFNRDIKGILKLLYILFVELIKRNYMFYFALIFYLFLIVLVKLLLLKLYSMERN